jgi:oligopeptide/dipeptide ABC transporter ATP-binding protein
MSTPLLQALEVTKVFRSGIVQQRETVALQDFSITIQTDQPSIISVVGESGSGKSTMARLLLGMESPSRGQMLYLGKDLSTISRKERQQFRRDVQAVFQDPFGVFNSFYKVDHVLEVPIAKFGLARSGREARALMEKTLQAVGLRPQETLGRFPHQLSGGQRQRIMVARALLLQPKLIIADEPVSMIDASLRGQVLDTLRNLNEEFGISLIYITHDLTTAYQISSDIIVLYSGIVAEVGSVERVVKAPKHPYTQLLVGSIPLPDPDRQWDDEPPPSEVGRLAKPGVGCKFAPRCPHAFEPCIQKEPPLFMPHPNQAATCYLNMEHDVLPAAKMDATFVRQQSRAVLAEEEVLSDLSR